MKKYLSAIILCMASYVCRAQDFSVHPYAADSTQRELHIAHVDEHGVEHQGVMICNAAIAADVLDIFRELYRQRYPVHSIRPVSEFGGDDERSMRANNTSAYNVRRTRNGGVSRHARGMAIDVNPLWNPCVHLKGRHAGLVEPATAKAYVQRGTANAQRDTASVRNGASVKDGERDPKARIIKRDDLCYRLFVARGFRWGGSWRSLKDYQHFEK